MKMTIHQGLSELKLLSNKIKRGFYSDFIGIKQNKADNVLSTNYSVEEFQKQAKANLQSVQDLINRRQAIKNAITVSNANTKVMVNGVEMTVAEAIEYKQTIELKEELLRELKSVYNLYTKKLDEKNEDAESSIERAMTNMQLANSQVAETIRQGMQNDYSWTLIDPINIKDVIKSLSDEVDEFKNNIDFTLSVSNATTMIEIDD